MQGGAVYLEQSSTSFSSNSFFGCLSNTKTDGQFGNAMFIYMSQSNLNESSFFFCAPDYSKCSDSCVCMKEEKSISVSCNGSNNYGCGGSGLVSIYDAADGTFVKFNKVCQCFDWFFIEFVRSNYIASHCEFVDASGQDYIFCVDSAIATFENCSFLNIYNKPIWQIGTNKYHYVNCITNENYPDMTNTEYNQPYIG